MASKIVRLAHHGGRHTGEFYQRAAPYQIPYGTILPEQLDNLAVPVACSSSHVGFCALRLEPIWMLLGEAAGEAIMLALEAAHGLNEVSPRAVRERLHASGAATIYTADVPEESPDFAAVQWWGSEGGFVSLDGGGAGDEPADYGKRGKQVIGQYHAAFPEHAVGLEVALNDALRRAWMALAERVAPGADKNVLTKEKTRGEFIRLAWQGRS